MTRLIIFDFDDTIVHLGVEWDTVKAEIVALADKNGLRFDRSEHLIPLSNKLAQHSEEMRKAIDATYLKYEMRCAETKNYQFLPGIEMLLAELKKHHLLAIASGNNTKTIETILAEKNLLYLFDIICGRDCIRNNKPEPDQLLWILRKARVRKEDAIFIGDSRWDEIAGEKAGIKTIISKPWTIDLMGKKLAEAKII